MLGGLISKIMGSNLTKNYEVDKDPYMHGGLHNLWKVYRGKKKDRNMMDVSIFIFDKKILDKKKISQSNRDDIYNILKRDPSSLAKLRHPNLLNLIEQPQEDQKFIVFVTEPVEYNLSSLLLDSSMRDLIPGDLEIKCLILDLMEALNFLHSSAKIIHMNLAPEHIYVTKEGKLKLGGLNFPQQFSTSDTITVPLQFDLRISDYACVPNLRFAAPEISDKMQCSLNSDIFSVGCLLFFMWQVYRNKDAYILPQTDITDKGSHKFEVDRLKTRLPALMNGIDNEMEQILRQLLNTQDPLSRGPLTSISNKQWFQDPLLKAVKYLENLDQKDHNNKVQFLNGITRILEKFDKKSLIKKVIPLLLDQMKTPALSVSVLPSILDIMDRQNFVTTTEFRDAIWPSIIKLCKQKELPAQSLFLILKNSELFMKYVGPQEFQQNFLTLINKSLECGVPKLQFLALTKIPLMVKQLDYQVVRSSLIPRMLSILEKAANIQIKQKTLEILHEIIGGIDPHTMKDKIMKTFEKIRTTESDPQVCMLLLKIYEQMARVLGVEEIGLKILPGIIPMLISGTFTREQFKEMLSSVRRLLDQIEVHRDKDLRDMGSDIPVDRGAFDFEGQDKALGSRETAIQNPTSQDVYDFLNSLDGNSSSSSAPQSQSTSGIQKQFQSLNVVDNNASPDDIFKAFTPQQEKPKQQQQQTLNFGSSSGSSSNVDPFASIQNLGNTTQQKSGGWDSDLPKTFGKSNNNTDDFFNQIASNKSPQTFAFGQQEKQQQQIQQPTKFGSSNLGGGGGWGGSGSDPFAELIEGEQNSGFGQFPCQKQNTGFGAQSNSFGNFSNPITQQTFQAPTNSMNIGNMGNQQNSGGFGDLNYLNKFQAPSQNSGFGQQQNIQGFGQQSNPLAGFGQQQQQQNKNQLNDDFFSQFTSTNQQPKQQNSSNFNLF